MKNNINNSLPNVSDKEWNADETDILNELKASIDNFQHKIDLTKIGHVISVADGIVKIKGLTNAHYGEIVLVGNNIKAMIMELHTTTMSAVLLEPGNVEEGSLVHGTGQTLHIPVTTHMLGRVVDPFGNILDDGDQLDCEQLMPLNAPAPKVLDRHPIHEPCPTGIKIIDAFIPIGKGQREMIIGDRLTGKTSIALDMIINQKYLRKHGQKIVCVYVAIGQQAAKIAKVKSILEEHDALSYTIIVATTSSDLGALQVQAPFAGCAIGEFFRALGQHVIVVYDDLTKHAVAYRELSLLLRRPPGREAYPGDIFYLHSRLLERAAKMSVANGSGSLTAIPIIETQEGNFATYIPTNVWSITDGQIVLKSELYLAGQKPAIDIGLSVSRVGGAAQIPAIKAAIELKLLLAQYQEYKDFAKYGADVDQSTQTMIETGNSLMFGLKQRNLAPIPTPFQAVFLQACIKNKLNGLTEKQIAHFEKSLYHMLETDYQNIANKIEITGKIDTELDNQIEQLFEAIMLHKELSAT